ncbi:hypothetical protein V1477_009039 [Vespula maculifrons]|uniref:Uncharacterized protein n=1 Tax=Vespula maculifrons TaxID=7453 RepID=A0ABD2CER2_VESMC
MEGKNRTKYISRLVLANPYQSVTSHVSYFIKTLKTSHIRNLVVTKDVVSEYTKRDYRWILK